MKTVIIATLVFLESATIASGQSVRHAKVAGPERIAVGMRSDGQIFPVTVEASKTGWVSVSFLSTRPDAGLRPPPFRMMAEARDVKTWVAQARSLESPQDSSPRSERLVLGNGAYKIEIFRPRGRALSGLSVYTCGPGSATSGPSAVELLSFVALLDSAATIAGGGEGRPPTLSRAYYSNEVSCPAVANATNQLPRKPTGASAHKDEIGVQFVVDTSGRVEPRSIRILPGTARSAARAVRSAVARWTFRPAEIDGTPVRQMVQTSVTFEAEGQRSPEASYTLVVEPTADGWVYVHSGTHATNSLLQQWFEPDSVEVWLDRQWGRTPEERNTSTDTISLLRRHALLGSRDGISLTASIVKTDSGLVMAAGFNGCAGAFSEGGQLVGQGQAFAAAARTARDMHQPPVNPTRDLHTAREVSCPAWLPWVRSARPGFGQVWRYPVLAYPASMRGTNVRAEVLASFVVDTSGTVEPGTIIVMPGANARAAAAVPAALRDLRFRPATRSGYKVRQRVIQALWFEPPPICMTRDASPACPRRYSKN